MDLLSKVTENTFNIIGLKGVVLDLYNSMNELKPRILSFFNATENSEISTSSYIEAMAEINRQNGASGIFSVRQYTADDSFKSSERVWDTAFTPLNMHNHPNYRGMPGSAEFSVMVNGYYIRTRHNDYRSFAPVAGSYLFRKEIMPPAIPGNILAMPIGEGNGGPTPFEVGTQYKYMRDIYQNNPEDCVFYMSYLECWWEDFDNTDVGDNTDSFRHEIDAANMKEALEKALYFNAGGHKNRKENIPYQPIIVRRVNDQGVSELATFRYRINVMPVATLSNEVTTKTFQYADGSTIDLELSAMPYDQAKAASGLNTVDNKFLLRKDLRQRWWNNRTEGNATSWEDIVAGRRACFDLSSGALRDLCEKVPGMLGPDAVLQEEYTDYGFDDILTEFGTTTVRNSAFYNKRYSFADKDAAGRTNAHRGFNDPNLFVAQTTNVKVVDGFSYMLPFEMILRTPRELWNPDNIPDVGFTTAGSATGDTAAEAMPGYHFNNYNFTIPADLFLNPNDADFDVADTRYTAWIDSTGTPKKYYGSGIKIFDYDGQRRRFPVFANYHDFSKASGDVDLLKKEVKVLLKGINNGAITDAEIDNAF